MNRVDYAMDENTAILTMNNGPNRFNPDFLSELSNVLDRIEYETEADSLIIASADEKSFSTGIDVDWLIPVMEGGDRVTAQSFFHQLNGLLKRLLLYPMPTIAAVNGHVFGAGTVMVCACDFRFMRTKRGFFCLPEVDIGVPFLPGSIGVILKAVPRYKFEEMQISGKRLTAEECECHHIIRKACPIDDLMDLALEYAKGLKKKRAIIHELKLRSNKETLRLMEVDDLHYIEKGTFKL